MTNSSKISVIVPVYNVERYLKRCLDSIIAQTYENLEIILVDDGSTDASPQICDEYLKADSRFVVIHKENQGAGEARNAALKVATGDYYAFVDADDYLDIYAYEKMMTEAHKVNADLVIVGAKFVNFAGNVRKTNMNPFYPEKSVFRDKEIHDVVLNMLELHRETSVKSDYPIDMALWKGLFKADIVKDNNISFFTERIYKSEDFIFYMEFVPRCKVVSFINEGLYYHCDNEDSISHNYSVHTQDKNDEMIRKMLEKLSEMGIYDEYSKGAIKVYLEATLIVIFDTFRNNENITYKKAREDMDYVCSGKEFTKYVDYMDIFSKERRNHLYLWLMKRKCYFVIFAMSKFYLGLKKVL